ncbi:hypothetical protein FDUTEX481_00256 [Tolypothrix sp. PCC 7601]|nr:hypothetical protein FDUTEX481_00256 [Tolypothrix sp. PCC 7601]
MLQFFQLNWYKLYTNQIGFDQEFLAIICLQKKFNIPRKVV